MQHGIGKLEDRRPNGGSLLSIEHPPLSPNEQATNDDEPHANDLSIIEAERPPPDLNIFFADNIFPQSYDSIEATLESHHRDPTSTIPTSSTAMTAGDGRPFLRVKLNGVGLAGLLDTGASRSVISRETWRKLPQTPLASTQTALRAANGGSLNAIGQINTEISYGGKDMTLLVLVVEDLNHALILGMDFWRRVGFQIVDAQQGQIFALGDNKENLKVHTSLTTSQMATLERALKNFKTAQSGEVLPKTNVIEHTIELIPGAQPFNSRAYHYSPTMEKKMKEELDRMLLSDIIEPSQSPVASPMVPRVKTNGQLRLCLDSRRLNTITKVDRWPLPNLPMLLGRLQ